MNNPYDPDNSKEMYNPYQAPIDYEVEYQEGELLDEPKRVSASAGIDWIQESWRIFRLNPGLWILTFLAYIAIMIVSSIIPVLNIVTNVLNIYFMAGMAYIAYRLDTEENASIGDLFAAFSHNPMGQIKIVLWSVLFIFLPGILIAVLGFIFRNSDNFVLLMPLAFLLLIPITMASYLSPILVMFHQMPALDAMKLSLKACSSNILAMLVFGVMMTFIAMLSVIPLGLGLFIVMPMAFIATYVIYKNLLLS